MADKSIVELAVAQQMSDEAKLVVYQGGETRSIEGQLIKGYAKDAVKVYVEGAKTSAQAAAESAASAETAREGTEAYAEQAGVSATKAAGSATTAQGATTEAAASKTAAQQAAADAQASKDAAALSETNAAGSETAAQAAKMVSEAAQRAAETAKASAELSATTATNKAAEASQKATEAGGSATAAAGSATAAGESADAAEQARQAIEALGVQGVTLPAGGQVAVEKIVAADGAVTLRFSIPQGDKGGKGDTGATGGKGDKGDKGDTGPMGPTGPKGDTGDQGVSITSIERTAGTGAAGTTDTYTITLSDGSTSTFGVYNGRNGEGSGDMVASVYDPAGKSAQVATEAELADLPIKKLVGTEAHPVNLDDLMEPGIYYIDGVQTTTREDNGLLENDYKDSPLIVKPGKIQIRYHKAGIGTRARALIGDMTIKFPAADFVAKLGGKIALGGDKITGLGAPVDATDAATMGYVDGKVAEAGDMQSSVYDPQGRGEDVFAAIDQKTAYQQAVSAGYTGTEAEFYAALVALKDGPFLPTKGGNVTGLIQVDTSALPDDPSAGLQTYSREGYAACGVGNGVAYLNAGMQDGSGIFEVLVYTQTGKIDSTTPDPETELNIANKRYVDTQMQTRAAADHVHTAEEVGALPADVSDITDINTISGPDGSVMIDMSAGLTISLDGADRIVVEQTEIYICNTKITGVKAPTAATDAANKEYVDSKTLVFAGKTVPTTAWTADTTYSAQGYGWRAAVACAGVTASHRPDVAYSVADAVSGNFAPVADSYAGGVYIYCKTKPTATVTIPSIVCVKGV